MSVIHISKRENPYVQIDKRALEDNRLSWRAKGILAYLLSKPSGWKVNVKDIWNNGAEGRNAVQDCLVELQKIGYAELKTVTGEHGKLMGSQWVITEEPKGGFSGDAEKPKTGKPINRKSGSRVHSNNEEDSNNELTTTKEKIDVAVFDHEVNALVIESFHVEEEKKEKAPPVAPTTPTPPAPGESEPRRYDAFNIDSAASELKDNPFSAENFARITGTSAFQMIERFTAEVDVFVLEQKAKQMQYNRFDEFSSHFFNYERAKVRTGRNGGATGQPGQPEKTLISNMRQL